MNSFFHRITTRQIVLAGCLVTVLYALFSHGVYHSDEHYQILEYARMKLFGTSTDHLAWEYPLRMRPGLQPLLAWAVGRALLAVGLYSPFAVVSVLQLLSGLLSVSVMLLFYRTVRDELATPAARKWFLVLGFFLWFLAYLHVHFNAEMLSGNLLLLLAALTLRYRRAEGRRELGWGVVLGLVAGATFAVRFQTGFALMGYGLWLLAFNRRVRLYAGMAAGVCAMLAVGLAADSWLYGEWTLTPLNYLRENILNAQMDKFGAEPWWYYFTAPVLEGAVVFGLPVLAATLWFFYRRPRHVVTWMLVPFLAAHFFLAHKEVRFFFPVLFFAPWFLVLLFREFPARTFSRRGWRYAAGAVAVLNLGAMFYCLTQDTADVSFYKMMRAYCRGKGPVVALNLAAEQTYYSQMQRFTTPPRVVEARFYMPDNFENLHFATQEELEAAAHSLTARGRRTLVLSRDPALEEKSSLPLKKIVWTPYPGWVMRHFNFNDWTRFSVRSKNVYEVTAAGAADEGR